MRIKNKVSRVLAILVSSLSFITTLSGCRNDQINSGYPTKPIIHRSYKTITIESTNCGCQTFTYTTITIDGCEYIAYKGANGHWEITHKGTCTNLIHTNGVR